MSTTGDTRFRKGTSGNPKGRPKKRRPNVSAFDIIFDKTLTVTQGGVERKLTVDEALELQTYQAALAGNRMAERKVLKMIAKREAALAKRERIPADRKVSAEIHYSADNANEAMRILGIAEIDPSWGDHGRRWNVATWAAQAGLSRPGRRKLDARTVDEIRMFTIEPDKLRFPPGRLG